MYILASSTLLWLVELLSSPTEERKRFFIVLFPSMHDHTQHLPLGLAFSNDMVSHALKRHIIEERKNNQKKK
jgi:hypothetical protein